MSILKGKELPSAVYKLLIVFATMCWGLSFVVLKESVETLTPAWVISVRFVCAGLILLCFTWKRVRASLVQDQIIKGAVCGVVLFTAFWVQTIGLTDTTPGKNAFLTATYCVIVPFIWWIVAHKRPTRANIAAAIMCVVGIGCVSMGDDFTVRFGDAITLVCAVLYAVHIVLVAKWTEGMDVYALTVFQFIFGGIFGVLMALVAEPLPNISAFTPEFIWNMAYLIIFASLIALLIQNVALSHVPPAQASLFLSLESVFGVLFSVLLYGEQVTERLALGFALIFFGIMVSELGAMRRKEKDHDELAA